MPAQQTGFFRHDGHRLAYASVGEGPPLVLPAWWVSNIVEDWKDDGFRALGEGLAQGRQVIRYDRLGCGMSDRVRPPETLNVEFEVRTLAALIDELGLERVTLFGGSSGGPTAIVYAARFPERVDRVALYGTFAHGAELAPPDVQRAYIDVVRTHWGVGARMLAEAFIPSGDARRREAFASFQRRSANAETAASILELMYGLDVREEAAALRVPTLVVHRRDDRAIRFRAGERLAALLPDAEFVAIDGDDHLPWHDPEQVIRAFAPFLGLATPAAPREAEELTPREREVLSLVAEGLSDADIASRLVVSPHTVHRHVANIFRKLGLNSRAAAAAWAARSGMA